MITGHIQHINYKFDNERYRTEPVLKYRILTNDNSLVNRQVKHCKKK